VRVVAGDRRSAVVHAYAASPLRLLTPRNHGRAAWIYTSSYGGGLVGGDHLRLDVEVDAGAAVFVSSQASTKVYRSPLGSRSELTARISDRGLLVVAPDPVVCFAASTYHQSQRFELERHAGLVAVDWMTSGRRAAGERWAFDEYASRTRVHLDGVLVLYDNLVLRRAMGDLVERMGRFDVVAAVIVAGRPLRDHASAIVATLAAEPLARKADRLVAAAPLSPRAFGDVGCLVRVAGRSVEDVGNAIRKWLTFVTALLGDDPWRRKW
jgi:urease accessory protein